MVFVDGGSSLPIARTTPAISIPVSPSAYGYFQPRKVDEDTVQTNLQEMIDAYVKQHGYRMAQSSPYWQNLVYIKDHPPQTKAEKEQTTNDILNGILDAIGYASAFASFIPFPAFQIGGVLGYGATNVGRAFLSGNTKEGLRNLNQLSRNFSRVAGNYRWYSQKMGKIGSYRFISKR